MRIPSQFNQDSLYRPQGRPRGSQSDHRRLLRLIVALVLLLVVMQQASRPESYRVLFGPDVSSTSPSHDQGPFGARQDPPQGATSPTITDPESETQRNVVQPRESEEQVVMADRLVATELLDDLLPTDQRQWTVGLSRWLAGRPIPFVPSSIESLQIRLRQLDQLEESQRAGWQQMLLSIAQTEASQDPDSDEASDSPTLDTHTIAEDSVVSSLAPTAQNRRLARALLAALDEAASSRVVDGSVWRPGDFDSLYRFLDQSDQYPRSGVTRTGVLPLLQQPDVFRDQWVSIHGGVARAERIEAKENPYAISHYWQLWLRPQDGADRPMLAIVRDVPQSVAQFGAASNKRVGPEIVVVGRFLKRLAYTSGVGADLAPVVIGQIIESPVDTVTASNPGPVTASTPRGWPGILPVVVACAIGLLVAAVIMKQTAVSARRGRELRAAHRTIELPPHSVDARSNMFRTDEGSFTEDA